MEHAATSGSPAASASAPAPASANPAQPTTPGAPAVVPSASVKKLQQQLGQLNYYEGSVDGIMGPQTTAAIKDLQRQANLPQTGTMNAATQAAWTITWPTATTRWLADSLSPLRTTQWP
ncbi:MAG TPA: peptidoglycan-binding domain-containing protein [Trebonia sp.]